MLVGGMISASSRKNTVSDSRMEIHNVTYELKISRFAIIPLAIFRAFVIMQVKKKKKHRKYLIENCKYKEATFNQSVHFES